MDALHKHKPIKKDTLIQFRVNSADKVTIQRAAQLKGMEPSFYMRSLVLESAKKDINIAMENQRILLSNDEWEHFVKTMKAPVRLNKNLNKAFSEYKKKYK